MEGKLSWSSSDQHTFDFQLILHDRWLLWQAKDSDQKVPVTYLKSMDSKRQRYLPTVNSWTQKKHVKMPTVFWIHKHSAICSAEIKSDEYFT